MLRVALVLALALAGVAIAQPPPPPPVPIVKVEGLRNVSPHVQVIPDNSVGLVPNVGFIVGTKGVLVVDTGLGPKNGAAVYAVAQRLARGQTVYLVTTHVHPEHDLGAQSFPAGTKLIRSKAQVAEIQAQGLSLARTFASRSPAIAELLEGAQFRAADITYDEAYSLDRLEALKPAVVVPSHGPVGDVGFIQGYRAYLKEVAERTAAAKAAGLDLTATTARVQGEMAARYPDAGRLAGAVRVAYGS